MNSHPNEGELLEIVNAIREDAATDQQLQRLNQLVSSDPLLRDIYADRILLDAALNWLLKVDSPREPQPAAVPLSPPLGFLNEAQAWLVNLSLPSRVLVWLLGLGLTGYFVALVAMLAWQRLDRSWHQEPAMVAHAAPAMGRVIASHQPVWQGTSTGRDDAIEPGRDYQLLSGTIDIELTLGTRARLVGPTRWRLADALRIELMSGTVLVAVPPAAVGFTVATPTTEVVDLGTEFGVTVSDSSETEVAVYRGAVAVEPRAPVAQRRESAPTIRLIAGQSAVVDASGAISSRSEIAGALGVLRPPAAIASRRSLDVVDLVSGGDGSTHLRHYAFNPNTGEHGALPLVEFTESGSEYHPTNLHRFVDGVFTPNGESVVDTAGHKFVFRDSSGRQSGFNHIWAGGAIPSGNQLPSSTVLGNIDYASPGHGLLYLHGCRGLTIDLRQVRRVWRQPIVGFQAQVGNTYPRDRPGKPLCDVYVLVDGQPRFERLALTPASSPVRVEIGLKPTDNFLTLVATDGGDGEQFDWLIFGDPILRLDVATQE